MTRRLDTTARAGLGGGVGKNARSEQRIVPAKPGTLIRVPRSGRSWTRIPNMIRLDVADSKVS